MLGGTPMVREPSMQINVPFQLTLPHSIHNLRVSLQSPFQETLLQIALLIVYSCEL